MKNESLSRKDFFKRVSLFGISAIGATTLLKACGGAPDEAAPEPVATEVDDPCSDLSDLSEADINLRESLGYVAETPNPEERCDNCALWVPVPEGGQCGGCTILPGQPIHPAGWCNSWVAG